MFYDFFENIIKILYFYGEEIPLNYDEIELTDIENWQNCFSKV